MFRRSGYLLNRYAFVHTPQQLYITGGMCPIRHDYKSVRPACIFQERSNGCHLFGQATSTGIRKNIDWNITRAFDAVFDDPRQ